MRLIHTTLLLAALAGQSLTLGACTANSTEDQSVGTLTLPLQVQSEEYLYKLVNAQLTIMGATTQTINANPDDTVVHLTLETGDYLVRLEQGWQLQRVDMGGATITMNEAVLTSANPVPVSVVNQETASILFEFDVSGTAIAFGNGGLDIGISVCDEPGGCDGPSVSCGGSACGVADGMVCCNTFAGGESSQECTDTCPATHLSAEPALTPISCDENADCGDGEVCCMTSASAGSAISCLSESVCNQELTFVTRREVCVVPGSSTVESCSTGTCTVTQPNLPGWVFCSVD